MTLLFTYADCREREDGGGAEEHIGKHPGHAEHGAQGPDPDQLLEERA